MKDYPTSQKEPVAYVAIGVFHIMVTIVLLKYIFNANHINRDVIYAACAVYLL